MADTTLATFRIEQSLWDEFKTHCSQNGDSASSRIIKLILADMGKSENLTPLESHLDKRIESYLESHLDKFIDKASRTEIDSHSIQRLDSRIDSLREEITCINIDELLDSRIDHKIKQAIDPITDNLLTREEIEGEVIKSIDRTIGYVGQELEELTERVQTLEDKPIYGKPTPTPTPLLEDDDQPINDEDEYEGITASTLAPIFDEPENESIIDNTHQNNDSPSKKNLEGEQGRIKGQSTEVTENYTLKDEQIGKIKRLIKKTSRRKLAPLCRELNKQYNAGIPSKIYNNGTVDQVKQALIDILNGNNEQAKQGLIDYLLNL